MCCRWKGGLIYEIASDGKPCVGVKYLSASERKAFCDLRLISRQDPDEQVSGMKL